MWYTHFADTISSSEDKSLFNYRCLDLGLYTLTDQIPQSKYFCKFNIFLDEMHREAESIILEEKAAWIVTRDPDELLNEHYTLVMQETAIYQTPEQEQTYYLYARDGA